MNVIGNINQSTFGSALLVSSVLAGVSNTHAIEHFTNADISNLHTTRYTVPQSPMGEELHDILFSNPDFVKAYDNFSNIIAKDLDDQYKRGTISPMKYYRMKRGITQHQFAAMIGEIQPHVSRWENKRTLGRVPAETVEKIAIALSISIEEVLHGPRT